MAECEGKDDEQNNETSKIETKYTVPLTL